MTKKTKTADIAWPIRPALGDEMRRKLATSLTELLSDHKLTPAEFAGKVFGRDPKNNSPLNADAIRSYLSGEKFPNESNAGRLAKVLKVPLSRLLAPKGPLITPTPRATRTSDANEHRIEHAAAA
jgi:hypothetical protein